MTISAGEKVPSVTLKRLTDEGMQDVSTDDVFSGSNVVMFGVPGAFTPTCAAQHLPSFVDNADKLAAKGIDKIVCLSVNDPFVMKVWGEQGSVGDKVVMLPDGNGELTRAMGLEFDGSVVGLGERSKRFAMVAKDGVVTHLAVEENPGEMTVSSAEAVLENI